MDRGSCSFLLFASRCTMMDGRAVRQQLDRASASVCKYKLGCAGSGVEVGFVNECTLLHCFANASILAKPMDLIWKRDFVKEFRRRQSQCKSCLV